MATIEDSRAKQLKKFKALDEEWRADVLSRKNPEELNKMIRDAAVNIVELRIAKQLDEDLARIKEELATAQAVYKEGEAENALRIEFLVESLRAMGVNVPSFSKKSILKAGLPAKQEEKTVDEQLDEAFEESKKSAAKINDLVGKFVGRLADNLGEGHSVEISSGGSTAQIKGKKKAKRSGPVTSDEIAEDHADPDLRIPLGDDDVDF